MIRKLALLLLFLPIFLSSCERGPTVQVSRLMMGTQVSIKTSSPDDIDIRSAIEKTFTEMERISSAMDRFNVKGELAQINNSGLYKDIILTPYMYEILKRSIELAVITDGAFDVTVSPLMEAWGFYGNEDRKVPSSKKIDEALLKVGSEHLQLSDRSTLIFSMDGVEIDLSAIAKGYVVDRGIETLKEHGIESALIDAGGDLYCLGNGPGNRPWKVGLKHPRKEGLLALLSAKDMAIATSGDYQNYFEIDGVRYCHIIDPRTGLAIEEEGGVISATVIARDCATADGLASALCVLGPNKGIDLIETLDGVEAIIISMDGADFRIDATKGAAAYYDKI